MTRAAGHRPRLRFADHVGVFAVAYPTPYMYVSVIGDSYNAAEKWQFGLKLSDGGISNQVTVDAIWADIQKWWIADSTAYTPSNGFFSLTTHRLTEVKVARILASGKYPPTEASASHFFVPAVAGANPPLAGQIAQGSLVATLTTSLPRGLASKGRVFLPPSARYNTTTSGLISTADATAIADSVRILITALNANPQVGNVQVFSRGKRQRGPDLPNGKRTYTYPNPGAAFNVTGVRVGRVIDTQRRRRRALVESPVAVVVP